ncbi:MAG TPA: hypothetical protein VF110_02755 [Burkholderiales bacterium]
MRHRAYLPALTLLVGIAACSGDQSVSVANVLEPTVIKLSAEPGKHVVSLRIEGSGSINGLANVTLMLDGKAYRNEQLNGKVSFTWGGDWYSPVAEIHYRPSKVQDGKLSLQYRFETL